MNKKEAAAQIREWVYARDRNRELTTTAAEMAAQALEREVAREDSEAKKRVSLSEIEDSVRGVSTWDWNSSSGTATHEQLATAADIVRAVREAAIIQNHDAAYQHIMRTVREYGA